MLDLNEKLLDLGCEPLHHVDGSWFFEALANRISRAHEKLLKYFEFLKKKKKHKCRSKVPFCIFARVRVCLHLKAQLFANLDVHYLKRLCLATLQFKIFGTRVPTQFLSITVKIT